MSSTSLKSPFSVYMHLRLQISTSHLHSCILNHQIGFQSCEVTKSCSYVQVLKSDLKVPCGVFL